MGGSNGHFDYPTFDRNRRAFPPDELLRYAGKQVAWSRDGNRIVASGDSDAEVDARLGEQGLTVDDVLYSYVPRGDEVNF